MEWIHIREKNNKKTKACVSQTAPEFITSFNWFVSLTIHQANTMNECLNSSRGCNCTCVGLTAMAASAIVNVCDINCTARFESSSRSRQSNSPETRRTPAQQECAQQLMGRVCVCPCVRCVWDPKTERPASHGKTNYSTSPLRFGECRGGLISHQRCERTNRGRLLWFLTVTTAHTCTNTPTCTLWSHRKYSSTWTSIQLPCLCNVSFTEPGPLANSRPDPIFISGWKDGVEKHPPAESTAEIS